MSFLKLNFFYRIAYRPLNTGFLKWWTTSETTSDGDDKAVLLFVHVPRLDKGLFILNISNLACSSLYRAFTPGLFDSPLVYGCKRQPVFWVQHQLCVKHQLFDIKGTKWQHLLLRRGWIIIAKWSDWSWRFAKNCDTVRSR